MCFNLHSSITSFLIGTLSGLYLITNRDISSEKRAIGYFIVWISLIQIIEAGLYYFREKRYNILIRLLSICLGLQGFVIYWNTKRLITREIGCILYFAIILIALAITFISLGKNFIVDKETKCLNKICLDWTFIKDNPYIGKLLYIMYILIFYLLFTTDGFRVYGIMLAFTYIISYIIKPIKNSPSMWCISSAIISPLVIFLPK